MRTDGHGNYRNSAPCVDCLQMILRLNIKKLIFSTENDIVIHRATDFQTKHVSNGNRYIRAKNIVAY